MSYLNPTRLHFAGQFQANVSTVNNDPGHFDNAAFQSSYQEMQGDQMNGWFNPQGDASFRLRGCAVTSAWLPGGMVDASDPILNYAIADADQQVPAKMVDLDPEQQLVSEIWGLVVRIADGDGNTLMRGDFRAAAFTDIWARGLISGGGDANACAAYQSVLENLEWGDVSNSAFLTALKEHATDGLLSIKFNVDGINMNFHSPDFMCGRIVGTIGPASADEPRQLVLGRQFVARAGQNQSFFLPAKAINFFPAVVDAAASCIVLDLGNALPTIFAGGPIANVGDLTLAVAQDDGPLSLGTIAALGAGGYAQDPDWYALTAGVVALPMSAAQMAAIADAPLRLSGYPGAAISETHNGAFCRADQFVYRMSAGDTQRIAVYATQFGRPLANATINFTLDSSQLQPTNGQSPYVPQTPDNSVAYPPEAIGIAVARAPTHAVCDANGVATLTVTPSDPGTPRWFNQRGDYGIDGQVYGVRPAFSDALLNQGVVNPSNFISFLLWSGYVPGDPVTWDDVQPIFQQYANLYPVMNRFLNLGDMAAVTASAPMLSFAFALPMTDPNAMPVTRDLSPAKRQAILKWLENPLPGTKPTPTTMAFASVPAAVALQSDGPPMPRGGKAAALARRLILRNQ